MSSARCRVAYPRRTLKRQFLNLKRVICQMDAICGIAKKYNIMVIEDCAQLLGAEYKGKKAGTFCEASYFTFGVTKNFMTFGGERL